MLVHWENTNSKHKHSTTANLPDSWDFISPRRRENHTCFDPDKDTTLTNLGLLYDFKYSMGIRQKLAEEFGSTRNLEGKLGRQHTKNVIVTTLRSSHYNEELAKSIFCDVLPGNGWSDGR